jgi:transcriptional regulator with PAS, ATPase and Fis domain
VAATSSTEPPTGTLVLTGSDGEALVSRRWRITVEDGPDRGKVVVREAGTVVVGSHADADLSLSDPSVSRYHAELRLMADGVLVIDLGSTNGTRIGNTRVDRCLLPPGGVVRFGHSRIKVEPDDRPIDPGPAQARFGDFVTRAPALAKTLAQLGRAAATEATVLIQGETGTGKELLARATHQASPRASGPLVVVDSSAVQENLLEGHLFGHLRGAFTGAVADRSGAFEAAQGGTVFLDEIGELPLDLQPKLLRVLEARTIRRLGDVADRPVDVRFVAATNRDLAAMVQQGTFRGDLYYRIAVVRVRVPPLRDRPEDVPLLCQQQLEALGSTKRLSPSAEALLVSYDWPGNARELRNVLQRAVALAPAEVLQPEDLFPPDEPSAADPFHQAKEKVIEAFEQRYVRSLLAKHQGNVSSAAREAGLSRNALYALMKRAGME